MDRDQLQTDRKKTGWVFGVAFLAVLLGGLTMFADVRAGFVILLFGVVMACAISGL